MRFRTVLLDTAATLLICAVALLFAPVLAGIKPYVVLSASMEPCIHTGSLTYVDTTAEMSDVEPGDIVTFTVGGNAVTHRVVKIESDLIFTKGDANESSDLEIVGKEKFIGKTVFSIPVLGYVVSHMKSPYMIIGLIFIVGLYIIWSAFKHKEGEQI